MALGVGAGDEIAYSILDGEVLLTKAQPPASRQDGPFEDPLATFWEWETPKDDEAYKDL